MSPVQILLISVVSTLTILLVFVGIQVFFILKDIRKTLDKANKILEDAGTVTSSVVKPILSITSFLENVKDMRHLANLVTRRQVKNKVQTAKKIPDDMIEEEIRPQSRKFSLTKAQQNRFFKRSGKSLTS